MQKLMYRYYNTSSLSNIFYTFYYLFRNVCKICALFLENFLVVGMYSE